jgi:hypothetical protein
VISFSAGREDLASCHLMVDDVKEKYRPLPDLLIDHLAQGVWKCCVSPDWKDGNSQRVSILLLKV